MNTTLEVIGRISDVTEDRRHKCPLTVLGHEAFN